MTSQNYNDAHDFPRDSSRDRKRSRKARELTRDVKQARALKYAQNGRA